jgi:hypothetical protein
VLKLTQLVVGAVMSALAAYFFDGTIIPLALLMCSVTTLGCALFLFLVRSHGDPFTEAAENERGETDDEAFKSLIGESDAEARNADSEELMDVRKRVAT